MNVLAYDVRENPAVKAMGIPYGSWEEVVPQCDVISLHMPLLPSTKYFIDVRTAAFCALCCGCAALVRRLIGGPRHFVQCCTPRGPSPPTPTPQAAKINIMKQGVTILNVSRGGLIDTSARRVLFGRARRSTHCAPKGAARAAPLLAVRS